MANKTDRGRHSECEIIKAYIELKEKYGEIFPHIGKEKIYSDISEKTKHSQHRVGIIVRGYTKGEIKYRPEFDY